MVYFGRLGRHVYFVGGAEELRQFRDTFGDALLSRAPDGDARKGAGEEEVRLIPLTRSDREP
jgi:hypothetical protein